MFVIYENGCHIVGPSGNPPLICGKRGRVTRFSNRSSRALRDLCCRLAVDGRMAFAITLTVPRLYNGNLVVFFWILATYLVPKTIFIDITPIWSSLIKRYRERLRKCGLGAIWRIELQRRGVPHLHMIGVCDGIQSAFDYWNQWIEACSVFDDSDFVQIVSRPGFLEYSVRIRYLNHRSRWFRYLIGHAAKHKQSQLGWQGRQWGVFNREFLKFYDLDQGQIFRCSNRAGQLVMRTLRRHYSRGLRQYGSVGTTILNIDPDIIRRLLDYYSQFPETPF